MKSVQTFLRRIRGNFFLVGLFSLLWVVLRTGTKPSRAVYPCQRVAVANSSVWFASFFLNPLVAVYHKLSARFTIRRLSIALVMVVVGGSLVAWGLPGLGRWIRPPSQSQLVSLNLPAWSATSQPASDIFVVNGTLGTDSGVSQLLNLMGQHGVFFYQSPTNGAEQGPTGLIAPDDVVIIKTNCQWEERGGTNTDLLKLLLQAIVQHPDGFKGEIVVADNGQGRAGAGFNWTKSNAEDHSQSAQDVVDLFSSSHNVSTYRWDTLSWSDNIEEYSSGDSRNGYVVSDDVDPETGLRPTYPKFQTAYGTYVSFKKGIWSPTTESYDQDRLKVLNVPVLKTHSQYGVTASIKHYMGVVSQWKTRNDQTTSHDSVGRGGMGTEMVETRFPTLNIIDAIWINAVPRAGPKTPYEIATRVNIIAASTDPIALDYWASKYILLQTAQKNGYSGNDLNTVNPDNTTSGYFGDWLRLSMQEITTAGYHATVDESSMNVYLVQVNDFIIIWDDVTYVVPIDSNSTISCFSFDQQLKTITFNVTGPTETAGFCNITLPTQLLGDPYMVYLDGSSVTPVVSSNATHTALYITYLHSPHTVQIIGTTVISEFPTIWVLILLLAISAATLVFVKGKRILSNALLPS